MKVVGNRNQLRRIRVTLKRKVLKLIKILLIQATVTSRPLL